ncbi:MAG: hypothetical protein C4536_03415 [Actinobacteria bacterium]|jgi:hypothetical protein|nr:MAG: hypothetical protein C4536_03415 [Actinomycetota bacterium]
MLWTIEAKDEYGYGYTAGRCQERLFRVVLNRAASSLNKAGADPALTHAKAKRHLVMLEDRYPAQLERIGGLASALGVEPHEVVSGGMALASLSGTACTNFTAVPPATSDAGIYVSWNLDLSPFFRLLIGRMPLYIRDVAGSKPYVCMGLPVLFGVGVMNGDGLSACVNSVGAMDSGEGLTFFELNNLAMETQATVDGAVEVWRDNPREVVPGLAIAIIMNSNSIFADLGGDAAVIEHSHNHMAVEKAAGHDGVLASANHHQFLDRSLSGGADPVIEPQIAGSYARLARMWELLDDFRGNIDPLTARMIARDHGLNYSTLAEFGIERSYYEERIDDATICCHPWNLLRHLRRLEFEDALVELNVAYTLNHILMDPKRCTIYITLGKPCRKQYIPIWLGDALRMEWADEARGEIDYAPDLLPRAHAARKDIFRRPDPTQASESIRSVGLRLFAALDRMMASRIVKQ